MRLLWIAIAAVAALIWKKRSEAAIAVAVPNEPELDLNDVSDTEDGVGTGEDIGDSDSFLDVDPVTTVEVWMASDYPRLDVYPPHSSEAQALFRSATEVANIPTEWAASPALHFILAKESGGRVGIPNYTYGDRARDPSAWPEIWAELRAGRLTGASIKTGPSGGLKSSATGLGQLILPNVRQFYPSGVNGIGDPLEEAVGMLRYIKSRYGTPEAAWARYGKAGEGY